MGIIAGTIGIIPSKEVVFKNATGKTTQIFQTAKQNYDNALSKLTEANAAATTAKIALDSFDSYFQPIKQYIDANNYHPVFQKILKEEGYGDPFYGDRFAAAQYKKWIPQVANMRNKYYDTQRLTNIDWEYIYNDGIITSRPLLIAAQKRIVTDWKDAMDLKRVELKGIYDLAVQEVASKQKIVDDAKSELDKAIKAEQIASDQRIKELEKDPKYIAAKTESDRIILEAELKRKRNRNILILGLAGIALIGVIAVIRKK